MWVIGIVIGAVMLLAGFLVKEPRARTALRIAGGALLLINLVYGGLVVLLLSGID